MTAEDFDNLHHMLREAKDFSKVQDAFFDLAEQSRFFLAPVPASPLTKDLP